MSIFKIAKEKSLDENLRSSNRELKKELLKQNRKYEELQKSFVHRIDKLNNLSKEYDNLKTENKYLKKVIKSFSPDFFKKQIEEEVKDIESYSINDLSNFSGRSVRTFRDLIEKNKIKLVKNNLNRYMITKEDWEQFLNSHPEYRIKKEKRIKLKK